MREGGGGIKLDLQGLTKLDSVGLQRFKILDNHEKTVCYVFRKCLQFRGYDFLTQPSKNYSTYDRLFKTFFFISV